MYEALIQEVVREVRKQLRPRALLLGSPPPISLPWVCTDKPPYDVVLLGSMTARQVLQFPCGTCIQALLEGKPVYAWEEGLSYRSFRHTANRSLWSKLLSAERQMKQLGVQFLGQRQMEQLNVSLLRQQTKCLGGQLPVLDKHQQSNKLITAQEARQLLAQGQPVIGRLTPLARDIVEGKA